MDHASENRRPAADDGKLLTICVPSYNAESTLDRCLTSLCSHRMAQREEVLVIDDGSTDGTARLALQYEQRYPGIVRLISKPNGGHGSAINRALDEAQGRYFKNVDSDDWVEPEALAALLDRLAGPETADLYSSDYDIVFPDGKTVPQYAPETVAPDRVYRFSDLDADSIYFTIHSMTIRTELLRRSPRRLQEHTFYVDCEYILFPIPFVETFVFVREPLYRYAQGSSAQSVDLQNMIRRYDQHDRVMRSVIDYGNETPMSPEAKRYYDAVLRRLLYTHDGLSLLHDNDRTRARARAAAFRTYLEQARPDLAKECRRRQRSLRWMLHMPEYAWALAPFVKLGLAQPTEGVST